MINLVAPHAARLAAPGQFVQTQPRQGAEVLPATPPDNTRFSGDNRFRRVLFGGAKMVVVSNRGPSYNAETETFNIKPGGLATALSDALSTPGMERGLWMFWNDSEVEKPKNAGLPYDVHPVNLGEKELDRYYNGFSNRMLWPVLHSLQEQKWPMKLGHKLLEPLKQRQFTRPVADRLEKVGRAVVQKFHHRINWHHYQNVNRKFADAILEKTDNDDLIWIQDYHLMLAAGMVSAREPDRNMGFFCHIPFPSPDVFRTIPHHKDLLKGLLGNDVVGFHTKEYVENFLNTVDELLPDAEVDRQKNTVAWSGRRILVKDFPISIDPAKILEAKRDPDIQAAAREIREQYPEDFIGVGVDRLDYTKGIPQRLQALDRFLGQNPQYQGRVKFIQVSAPSRESVKEYQQLKREVTLLIQQINAKYPGEPVVHIDTGLPHEKLIPLMMASDFALVTPLKDGMNLVAKEYAVAQPDNRPGVLILSNQAGAAHEMTDALQVNPRDINTIAGALKEAIEMPSAEKQRRAKALSDQVVNHDVNRWQKEFMSTFQQFVAGNG